MKNFEENKLENIFVLLVTEQWWSGTSPLLGNQNHKNEFTFILLKNLHFGRTQLLIVKGTLGTSWKGLFSYSINSTRLELWISDNKWFTLSYFLVLQSSGNVDLFFRGCEHHQLDTGVHGVHACGDSSQYHVRGVCTYVRDVSVLQSLLWLYLSEVGRTCAQMLSRLQESDPNFQDKGRCC